MASPKYKPPYGSGDPDASYQNGDAVLGVEGSIADARAWEWTQREIINVLLAAGITPDGDLFNQLAAAIQSLISGGGGGGGGSGSSASAALGQGRLTFVNAAQLKFAPADGNRIVIGGAYQLIPSGGITLANTGLAANTLHYVYAYMASSTMTLEASTTGFAVDAATGLRTKSGSAERTLVGMAQTGAGGVFQDGLVRSLFADVSSAQTTGAAGNSTYSLSPVILSASTLSVLCWDFETIDVEYVGHGSNSATNAGYYAWMRAIIANADGSAVLANGPQTRGGGAAYVATGLASRAIYRPGVAGLFTVRAEGYGDGSGAYASFSIAGFVRTRG